MAGLVPAIHVFPFRNKKFVDARHPRIKPEGKLALGPAEPDPSGRA